MKRAKKNQPKTYDHPLYGQIPLLEIVYVDKEGKKFTFYEFDS